MDRFARRDTIDSINLFYDVILCDKKIKNESEKEDFEASYFAMCLLLPKEPFLDTVNYLGGIDECYKNNNIILLSRLFNVEDKLIRVRLKELSGTLENEQHINTNFCDEFYINKSEVQPKKLIKRIINKVIKK